MTSFATTARTLGRGLCLGLALLLGTAHAQFPDKPVRIVVPPT
jgi:tripartite-type tricarboxylate transporter receptor subunit TctC